MTPFALQTVVQHGIQFSDVAEKITGSAANRFWNNRRVSARDRLEYRLVERVIEPVYGTVHILERVFLVLFFFRGSGARKTSSNKRTTKIAINTARGRRAARSEFRDA